MCQLGGMGRWAGPGARRLGGAERGGRSESQGSNSNDTNHNPNERSPPILMAREREAVGSGFVAPRASFSVSVDDGQYDSS